MSDDTIRAALTLDALVEEVAAEIVAGYTRDDRREINSRDREVARLALAAVAKRMGDPDRLRVGAIGLTVEAIARRETGPTLAAAFDDCATLLRTLAEAAP